MLGHREQSSFKRRWYTMQSSFQANTFWLVCCLILLCSCYSNRSIGRLCWHLDGLYFSDIWRGEWRTKSFRGLGAIQWLPIWLCCIGPPFGVSEHSLAFCQLESGGGYLERSREGEKEPTGDGWGEGWRNSWNVAGHEGLLFSTICALGFWEGSQRNLTCIVSLRAVA